MSGAFDSAMLVPTIEPMLCLRPGANIFRISADELQIAFPNYTVTFVSPPVVRGVSALLDQFEKPSTKPVVIAATAKRSNLEPSFLEYLISTMTNSRCLYESSAQERACTAGEPLSDFYA